MVLKTFNLDEEVYKKYSEYCKKNGISMSKKINNFIKEELNKINNSYSSCDNIKEHDMFKYC